MTMFDTILVANRGEIALRIMRTARRLGCRTVAVYSDADRDAPHRHAADAALRIGGAQPADSYLDIAAIIETARRSGAQAVHPGYGFLAERADFAQACADAGLVFIGPPPGAIRAMGGKAGAKQLMRQAGVPCIPGYDGGEQSDARLQDEAMRIGFPVMVKASAGGGGRGMRKVDTAAALPAALAAARSEALHAFGDAGLILEQALVSPRHIEIQVFADAHGNVVHMGERDCSVQRRHQKLIEETPSPAVDAALRARMGAVAVAAARAIGYRGAGTLEFLLDADGAFHFMEMNTRLQVEHAVTEAVLDIDLVEWQLRVAAGEALPLGQEQLDARRAAGGHAIEVRLCAEDARRGFLPQSGTVLRWQAPSGVRCDHALADGVAVPPYYDSMLAKIVSHGRDRADALRRLSAALGGTVLLGLASNREFLAQCVRDPVFVTGRATTDFIGRAGAQPGTPPGALPGMRQDPPGAPPRDTRIEAPDGPVPLAAAVAAVLLAMQGAGLAARRWPGELQGWSNSAPLGRVWRIVLDGEVHAVPLSAAGPGAWDAGGVMLRVVRDDAGSWRVETADVSLPLHWAVAPPGAGTRAHAAPGAAACAQPGTLYLMLGGADHVAWQAARVLPAAGRGDVAGDGRITAPMNGRIAALPVAPGDAVKAGQVVAVIEAMKMEHSLLAPFDGVIDEVPATVGGQASPGQLLLRVAA